MKNRKKRNKIYLYLLVILGLTVGFALLSTTLNITGTAGVNKNIWDIHWDQDSIQVTENSVAAETPTVTENGQKLSYEVTLELPGDFYEFTIDAVNAGTIDGMISIDGLNPTITYADGSPATLPSDIRYSVTYADGSPVEQYHKLAKRVDVNTPTREKFKIRIEFDKEATSPIGEDKTYKILDDVPYTQGDERAKDRDTSGAATLAAGSVVNAKLKQLAGDENVTPEKVEQVSYLYKILIDYYYYQVELPDGMTLEELTTTLTQLQTEISNSNITDIEFSDTLPSEYETDNNLISAGTSIKPIYAWFDTDTIYIYSEENIIYMNNNSSNLFSAFSSLNNIDLTRIDTSKTTDMNSMFFCDQEIKNLDLSGFEINDNANMENIFLLSEIEELDLSGWNFSKYNDGSLMDNFGLSNFGEVKTLILDNVILPENMSDAFASINGMEEISLKNVDTSHVTDMSGMFSSCSDLQVVDVSSFNTSNVTNMSNMFSYCDKLKELDLSSFNTSKVTNMYRIFYNSNIEELDLSNWNFSKYNPGLLAENLGLSKSKTIKVLTLDDAVLPSNMNKGFYELNKLEELSLNNVDTSSVTDMSNMFGFCEKIIELDLSSFNTDNVTNMSGMFNNCSSLTTVNISSFNTDNVTDMSWMFNYCSNLLSLTVTNFNTSNVTNMEGMFNNCSSLPLLNVSNFNTNNVTNMGYMFCAISNLVSLNLSNFNTDNVTSMIAMFAYCSSLTSLNISSFNTSNVTDMSSMFANCSSLPSLTVSNFNTSKVTSMSSMFIDCSSLSMLNITNFDTSKVTNMGGMFSGCSGLISLDLSSFYTPEVKNVQEMFYNCTNLITIYVSDRWTRQSLQYSTNMFTNCYSLVGGNGTGYSSNNANDYTYAKIDPYDESQGIYLYGYFTYKAAPVINNTGTARMMYEKMFGTLY